jgi:UDP-N-acetylmuramoylalanine--D-glutamate ligase
VTEGKGPVLVVGLARSGVAAARFLAAQGAVVVATDAKPADQLGDEVRSLAGLGVSLELGGHRDSSFTTASRIVVSPGVPWDLQQLALARAQGVPVEGEIELAWRHLAGRVIAITGTKGKSTTTAAVGAMLREQGGDVRVGGNIGEPLVSLVQGSTPATTFVVEVSSFQLEGISSFRPEVAVYLNLSPDHLDRHPSLEAYAAAKARIFSNQTEGDWAVVPADQAQIRAAATAGRARQVLLSATPSMPVPDAQDVAFFAGETACLRLDGREESLFSLGSVRLPGAHLHGDLLAAAVAARLVGASAEAVARAASAFRGAEHVLEYVATIDGIAFFNDSKATNVEAARQSIESFQGRVLLVAGGRYKGGDFADLGAALGARRGLVLAIGESRDRLRSALEGAVKVLPCDSLRGAVEAALREGRPGDTVVLAPACSSFDMFRDYAERGQRFKAEVLRLAQGKEACA